MNIRVCVGSQVIWDYLYGNSLVSKTPIAGAYDYGLIKGVFNEITVPQGYHKEYRLSAQVTTGGGNPVRLYLNNIGTNSGGTWSANSFRNIIMSDYFKESDIVLEPVYQYTHTNGTNLYYEVTGSASTYDVYNITIHGFLVKD